MDKIAQDVSLVEGTMETFKYLKSGRGGEKAEFIRKAIKDNKIQLEECIFAGNSDNDVWAYDNESESVSMD